MQSADCVAERIYHGGTEKIINSPIIRSTAQAPARAAWELPGSLLLRDIGQGGSRILGQRLFGRGGALDL